MKIRKQIINGRNDNMKCPCCGSERIEKGISWGQTAEVGNIGLRYVAGGFLKVVGVAEVSWRIIIRKRSYE